MLRPLSTEITVDDLEIEAAKVNFCTHGILTEYKLSTIFNGLSFHSCGLSGYHDKAVIGV